MKKSQKSEIDTFRNKFCQNISKSSFFVKFCARFCENRMYHFAFHFEQVFQCFFGDFQFQKWKILTFFSKIDTFFYVFSDISMKSIRFCSWWFQNRHFSLFFNGILHRNWSVKSKISFLAIFDFFRRVPHMISFSIFTYFFDLSFLFANYVLKKSWKFFWPYEVSNNFFLLFFCYRIFWRFFSIWSKKSHFRYLFSGKLFFSSKIAMFFTNVFENRCFSPCFFCD